MRLVAVVALALLTAGCVQKQARVRIVALGPERAEVYVAPLAAGVSPGEGCATPCVLGIEPFAAHTVTVRAEDYVPARFDLDWQNIDYAIGAGSPEPVELVIPLLRRDELAVKPPPAPAPVRRRPPKARPKPTPVYR